MSEQLVKRNFQLLKNVCLAEDPDSARETKEDSIAFAGIYRRYRDQVYGYMRLRTGSDEEAADLTQEVFLRALDALSRYDQRGLPFVAWLMRIARNAAIDAARRRRPSLELDLIPQSFLEAEDSDPAAELLERERLARLREAIVKLDHNKRDLLALRFATGLSSREIGLVIGKSEEAVKKQMGRILHRLKSQLEE